jgi:polysaccharide deacetylase family protein (PEP-CTERM system associated)
MINAMTIDVEDYFHVAALAGSVSRDQWDGMEYRAESSTRRLLEVFAQAQVKATFFVLGWVAKRSPHLVREIEAAGHEIASHGWSHKLVYDQSREEFTRETRDSKSLLEDITGHAIDGYRASTYSITSRSLWALDILCELGFKYDSSIFPIRHDLYGIPDAPTRPGVMKAPGGGEIVEFPMSVAPMAGFKLPVSGGGYFRLLPYWLTRMGLQRVNQREQRPFVFYLHPWEVDPEQPVVKAKLLSRFRHYTNLDRTESRLRRLLGEFRFAPVRDVLADLGLTPAKVV